MQNGERRSRSGIRKRLLGDDKEVREIKAAKELVYIEAMTRNQQ
jgi:hypothetical protein